MAKTKSQPQPFRRITDFANCQAAHDNWQKLQAQQATLRQQLEELRGQCGDADDTMTAAAQLVVGGPATAVVADQREKLEAVERELRVVDQAVEQQRKVWSALLRTAQQEMSDERLERHRQLVGAISKSLDNYRLAVQAEEQFIAQLCDDGGRQTTPLWNVFAQRDIVQFERIAQWQERMKRGGYLEK